MISLISRRFSGALLRALPLAAAAACFPAAALADDVASAPAGSIVSRDDFSITTKQGGAFHTRTFPEPVNFQNADGSWDPINRTLVSDGDGAVHPKDVDGDAAIPVSLDDPLRLEHDGRHLSFRLLGADGERSTAGSVASFDDAIPHADVKYRSLSDGLKESVVLDSPAARRVYSYAVTGGDDLEAKVEADGQVVFADSNGDQKFRVSAPLAWDSAADKAYSNALTLSVTKESAGHWTLTMRPDSAWLDDPARVYPVTLDPDFYWLNDGTGAERFHGANQDCYLSGGVQAAITYGAATTLAIGYYNRPYRANLRFDLAAAIPAYANITNAQLAMFLPGNTTHSAINSRVHTITSDWDNTATWNNRKTNTPWSTSGGGGDVSSAANLTGTVNPSVGNANYWYYWNTPLATVNGWIKGTLPNYGIQVSADSEVAATNAYSFVSTDGNQASWPALDVTWVPDTTPPSGLDTDGLGGGDQDTVSGSYAGAVTATATDDASGVKKFELLRDADVVVATSNVSCPGNLCPLATTASLPYNVTSWTEGDHTFKLRVTDGAGNVTTGTPWTITVDRTPPQFPATLGLSVFDNGGTTLNWSEANDRGSNGVFDQSVASYDWRYKVGTGAFSAWANSGDSSASIPTPSQTAVSVEVVAIDFAGNRSTTAQFSGTLGNPSFSGLIEGNVYRSASTLKYWDYANGTKKEIPSQQIA
ncbi:MAG: Ig-like domain repeat protein, partial [Patulibacter sp.]|nr:Ig-like domain repeat protein [Patulibacter sp.]